MGALVVGLVGHGVGAKEGFTLPAEYDVGFEGLPGAAEHILCAVMSNLSMPALSFSIPSVISKLNPIDNEFVTLKKDEGMVKVTSWT